MQAIQSDPLAGQNLILRKAIQKVATGPEYSKDLDYQEAYAAMTESLKNDIDPVQVAIFLIALRMKRETDEENKGVLRAVLDCVDFQTADSDQVVDIVDPYSGFARGLPVSPFLPALLASAKVCAYSHGLDSVGPKYGVTHSQVLQAAGVDTELTASQAVQQMNRIGWTYVGQKHFCPNLYELISLRTRMVKRPVLTTVEVLAGPLKGAQKTHLITGYVHKAYPPVYAELAKFAGFASATVVRGCEGGITPSLTQPSKRFEYVGDYAGAEDLKEIRVSPLDLGIQQEHRAVPIPENVGSSEQQGDGISNQGNANHLAEHAAAEGMKALQGEAGIARDSLLYIGAIVLTHLALTDSMQDAYATLGQRLDSGDAWDCFQQGRIT